MLPLNNVEVTCLSDHAAILDLDLERPQSKEMCSKDVATEWKIGMWMAASSISLLELFSCKGKEALQSCVVLCEANHISNRLDVKIHEK